MNYFQCKVEKIFKSMGYEFALVRTGGGHKVYMLVKGFECFRLVISSSPKSDEQALRRVERDIHRIANEKRIRG